MPMPGILRGAGEEKTGRVFDGVFVDGVGVAAMVEGEENPIVLGEESLRVSEDG